MTASSPTRFEVIVSQLPDLLRELLACPPHFVGTRPAVPHVSGVYLFSEEGHPLYVGRTRDCNRRLAEHTRPSSGQNSAPFAFNLTRRQLLASGQQVVGTRAQIAALGGDQFAEAKQRVWRMEFRFVEVRDPALSTIFEVYASLALRTEGEYNLFETH